MKIFKFLFIIGIYFFIVILYSPYTWAIDSSKIINKSIIGSDTRDIVKDINITPYKSNVLIVADFAQLTGKH